MKNHVDQCYLYIQRINYFGSTILIQGFKELFIHSTKNYFHSTNYLCIVL